ncbi:MAG: phospholipid carrier-dependent glycosyltransferase [Candidatus Acididesulfobacter guangdongensis]|uniref:Phospholipid carrier-dependent glycosyltransferase n=1 Tax=Acididesulfobacter guangdongensis TaxID=2597225 RepID=A0A519BFD0_ACIG2|nr:MAG: phospholipid carrier-dependent glycosyltransferase [Candidatus Acididesulfobacter guangdongensis]
MNKNKLITNFLFGFLIVLFIFRIIFITHIDLIPEETYYWQWSRHLSLSYYDMSPMIAYIIALTTFFGKLNSQFFVRLGAPVISLLISLFVYIILQKLTSNKTYSLGAAVLLNVIPIFNIGSILIVYGDAQLLFFSLSIFFLIYLILFKKDYYIYLIGAATGLALLSKYTAVFLYPIVFLFFLLSKNYRKYLLRKEPYIAFLISLLLFSPVIIWNYLNDYASLRHLFTLSGNHVNFNAFIHNLLLFIGSQAGIFSPFIFIILIFSMFYGFYKGIKNKDDIYLALSVSALVPFAYFLYQCTKTEVQPNWPVFLYFPAYIMASLLFFKYYSNRLKKNISKKLAASALSFSIIVGLLFSVLIFIEPSYPIIKFKLDKSPVRDVLGWRKLAFDVDKIAAADKKDNFLISARRFQVASELAYYMKGQPETYSFNYFKRNNEYSLWNNFKTKKGQNFLYVIDTKYGKHIEKKLSSNFKRYKLLKTITIRHQGQKVRTVKIYGLYDFLYKNKYLFKKFASKTF